MSWIEALHGGLENKFPPFHLRSLETVFQQHSGEAQALVDTAEAALLQMTEGYMHLARQHVEARKPLDESSRSFGAHGTPCN